jgi:phasin family protein
MKTESMFPEFDMKKLMGNFDLSKMMSEFKFPGVDMQALLETQQRNMEALRQANQTAVENMQGIIKRQGEMLQAAMSETGNAVRSIMQAGSPEDGARKQGEMAQRCLDVTLSNLREIAELSAKANRDIFDVINGRVVAGLEEVREVAMKAGNGTHETSKKKHAA